MAIVLQMVMIAMLTLMIVIPMRMLMGRSGMRSRWYDDDDDMRW